MWELKFREARWAWQPIYNSTAREAETRNPWNKLASQLSRNQTEFRERPCFIIEDGEAVKKTPDVSFMFRISTCTYVQLPLPQEHKHTDTYHMHCQEEEEEEEEERKKEKKKVLILEDVTSTMCHCQFPSTVLLSARLLRLLWTFAIFHQEAGFIYRAGNFCQ